MGIFSDFADKVLGIDPPKPPKLPKLPPPEATPERAQVPSEVLRRRRARVSGRKKTIVTGEFVPEQVGKVNLLGRTR